MKAKTLDLGLVFVTLAVLTFAGVRSTFAQGTAFTYQGRLQEGAIPANGSYDFRFQIYDALAGGNAVNATFTTNIATPVRDGLFTVTLDFGSDVFNGASSWLEIDVRTNGNGGFTTLTPRQPITSAPYAIQAINAATATTANVAKSANSVSAANITGTVELTQLPGAVVTNNEANVTLEGLTLSGTLHLPGTTTTGIIYSGSDTLIHAFGTNNFFAGSGAGNLKLSGRGNVGVGFNALHENTTGTNNTAVGAAALGVNSIGSFNTASGNQALANNTRGTANTATGWGALLNNTSGINNTGHGMQTLRANTTGNNNTANGFDALWANTTGSNNTANGFNALVNNIVGSNNTASGANALQNNTTGIENTANGGSSLHNNTAGSQNAVNGYFALYSNTTGGGNTANGAYSLFLNSTGSGNTANGDAALNISMGSNNTADGYEALKNSTTGLNNIALGYQAGHNVTTGSSNIDIGNPGSAGDDNTIRLGTKNVQTQTFVAGISGATVASGVAVYVDANGHLGTLTSSARHKREIHSMDDASTVLFALKPVTFRYKSELDPQEIPQFGLVAEDVDQIDPDLVARDDKNQVYTVRYEAVNAMLLNEFLKQHRKVEQQTTEIDNLKEKSAEIQTLKTQNDSLAKRLSVLEQLVQSLAAKK